MKLNTGDNAPEVKAKDPHGNTVLLSDFSDKKLFLYFFPKANTSG